jgi:hypothetical protein
MQSSKINNRSILWWSHNYPPPISKKSLDPTKVHHALSLFSKITALRRETKENKHSEVENKVIFFVYQN